MITDNPSLYVITYISCWIGLIISAMAAVRLLKGWRSRFRNLVSNAVALTIGISIIALSMEGYLGFFYDQTDSYGLSLTSVRWHRRHFRLNNMGFRDDRDYSYKRTDGKERMVFIGDSFTVGHGINDIRDRFSSLIEKRLTGMERDVEVYNMARSGWDTIDEVGFLNGLVEKGFEADIVVLCFNMNDIGFLSAQNYLNIRKISGRMPHSWLFQYSFLWNFLYIRSAIFSMPEARDYYDWLANDYEGNAWQEEERLLEEFIDICERNGYKLKVVILPLIGDLSKGFKMRDAHKRVSDLFGSRGIECIDMAERLKAFPAERLVVNRFDAHPNEFAHSIIAEEIWKSL